MIIGVDFDNTTVCYDNLFYKLASEKTELPKDLEISKSNIRDHLRKKGMEETWIELQGLAYGKRITEAEPFKGVKGFFKRCKQKRITIYIVSHKTLYPFKGEKINLHDCSKNWLKEQGFFDIINEDEAFFLQTIEEKKQKIKDLKITHFIDDLPEFLSTIPEDVNRILFDPVQKYREEKGFIHTTEWEEIKTLIDATLLLSKDIKIIEGIQSGKNNKVYRISADNDYISKRYFKHKNDKRDRLATEYTLLTNAWKSGIRNIPKPIARDEEIAVYSYIKGEKAKEITKELVDKAAEFAISLDKIPKEGIKDASEACITLQQNIDTVENRLKRLKTIRAEGINKEAILFIEKRLKPEWKKVLDYIKKRHKNTDKEYPKTISPSDFGFHNAIILNNEPYFIDFEYAGFDDPAKMVADFFCQPEIPVPIEYYEEFKKKIIDDKRTDTLLAIHRIKWCCIMLNEFLPDEEDRRKFSIKGYDPESHKKRQLEKTKKYLEGIVYK